MTDIVTLTEAKIILGISGTNQDSLITFHIESAQEILYQLLGVTDLFSHSVEKEKTTLYEKEYFYLDEFPVTEVTGIYDSDSHDEITDYEYSYDTKNKRKVYLRDSDGKPKLLNYNNIKVDYTAGYVIDETTPNLNIPNAFKTVVAFMIGGLMAENQQKGGVTEYKIGSKMVKFADKYQAGMAIRVTEPYILNYIKPCVL